MEETHREGDETLVAFIFVVTNSPTRNHFREEGFNVAHRLNLMPGKEWQQPPKTQSVCLFTSQRTEQKQGGRRKSGRAIRSRLTSQRSLPHAKPFHLLKFLQLPKQHSQLRTRWDIFMWKQWKAEWSLQLLTLLRMKKIFQGSQGDDWNHIFILDRNDRIH